MSIIKANQWQTTSGTVLNTIVQVSSIYSTTNTVSSVAAGSEVSIASTSAGLNTRTSNSKILYSVIIPYEVDNNSAWAYLVLYRRINGGGWTRLTESILMNKLDGGDGVQQSSLQYVDTHGAAVGSLVEYNVNFYSGDSNLGVDFNQPGLFGQKYNTLCPSVGFIAEIMG